MRNGGATILWKLHETPMWLKRMPYHLGMVTIPPLNMLMTGGRFLKLFYPHWRDAIMGYDQEMPATSVGHTVKMSSGF